MMQDPPIGLFDLDGTLADYESALRSSLRLVYPGLSDSENLWDREKDPQFKAVCDLIKSQPGWWAGLPMIRSGLKILLESIRIGFDCHVLTKGPSRHPIAWKEKVEWCQTKLPYDIDIHIVSDKKLVYGKFLFDDYPDYMSRWLQHRPRGLGIMPATKFNAHFSHPNVVKWTGTNLEEVRAALLAAYYRGPNQPLML